MNWLKKFWQSLTTPQATPPNQGGITMDDAYSNFTPRAQQVLALARKEADRFNHNFVGTEHLLLGIVALGQGGTAFTVLTKMGIDSATLREELEKQVGTGPDQKMIGNIPYTPRVKKVLSLAEKEAKAMRHTYVGTEHILLGLLREGDGVAARVLRNMDVEIEQTRHEILKELDPNISFDKTEEKPSQPADLAPPPAKLRFLPIDITKRYDVYCGERDGYVVYRNVRFKGVRSLYRKGDYDFISDFIELEEADGQTVFVSRSSISKFKEHRGVAGEGSAS